MKKIYTFLVSLSLLGGICNSSNSQVLTVSGSLFVPHDSIGFTYNSPSFSATDWIGIYHTGETPGGGPSSTVWSYIPVAEGSIYLHAPQDAGNYIAYLLCCDGYDIIATSAEFNVEVPSLTTTAPYLIQGIDIEFAFNSPKFVNKDRIGIYPKGTKPGAENPAIEQKYITSSDGTISFESNVLNPGFYDAYLLCCDGYDSITACTFEVLDATVPFVKPVSESFASGKTIEFMYYDPSFAAGDWIGIWVEYDDPTMVPSITYSQLISDIGTVSFPGVLPYGTYFAAMFCCSTTETEYARSSVIDVEEANTETYLKTTASVYPVGIPIAVNFRDDDFSATDWIGIYHEGEIPGTSTPSITWKYAPADSGTVEFSDILAVGNYITYLICCDGYDVKAAYSFSVVDETSPSLVCTKLAYSHGEAVELNYNSPDFVSTDWIGIYHPGDIPASVRSMVWDYLPQANGSMTFVSPYKFGTLMEENPDGTLPPGEYWVALFCCDTYGLYASTSFIVTENEVGMKNVQSEGSLKIFPNPTTGPINIRIAQGEKMQQITVYNVTGQVLYQEKPVGPVNEKLIDLKLSKGVYLLEVLTETSRMNKKLIIQ